MGPGSFALQHIDPALDNCSKSTGENARSRWRITDGHRGYGWGSILLHWSSAILIMTLWVVGTSIRSSKPGDVPRLTELHTSIAVTAYALLWGRIIWRFISGHPAALLTQNRILFSMAKITHYVLILAVCAMLVSGPLLVWSRGAAIHVFRAAIPSPLGYLPRMAAVMLSVHETIGWVVIGAIVLHVGGALKHTVFDHDGTLGRMLTPRP